MDRALLNDQLQRGLAALVLDVDESACEQLVEYVCLLVKWNQQYNLTAIRQPDKMVVYHLLDSLSIVPYLKGGRWIDIGAGAGLPGIPLAIVLPQKTFVLLDSNGKKTRFLLQAKQALGLTNVSVEHARFEKFYAVDCFDGILSRGVGNIADMLAMSDHLCCQGGAHFFMKGRYPADELAGLSHAYQVIPLTVPQLAAERHLVIVSGEKHG